MHCIWIYIVRLEFENHIKFSEFILFSPIFKFNHIWKIHNGIFVFFIFNTFILLYFIIDSTCVSVCKQKFYDWFSTKLIIYDFFFIDFELNLILPYKLITRMQLRIINGISSPVASRYSSNEPPNNFGWPVIFMRPMRLRFGTWVLAKSVAFEFNVESLANSVRNSSALASSRAILDVPRIYSRIF